MSTNNIIDLSVHRQRKLRQEAAAVVQRMFPHPSEVEKRLRHPIIRARNGHVNPVYRITEYLWELRRIGGIRERAEILLVYLQSLIEELWPSDTGSDYAAAVTRRREIAGRAQVIELRAVRDPAARALWAEATEEEIAAARVAVAAARRAA